MDNDKLIQELITKIEKLDSKIDRLGDRVEAQVELMKKDLNNIQLKNIGELSTHRAEEETKITKIETVLVDWVKEVDRTKNDVADLYNLNRQTATEIAKIMRETDRRLEEFRKITDERIDKVERKSGDNAKKVLLWVGGVGGAGIITWIGSLIYKAVTQK